MKTKLFKILFIVGSKWPLYKFKWQPYLVNVELSLFVAEESAAVGFVVGCAEAALSKAFLSSANAAVLLLMTS